MARLSQSPETRQHAIQAFEQVLRKAIEKKASDVHFKAGLPPIVRVNGNLYYLGDDKAEKIARLHLEQLRDFIYALMNEHQVVRYENGEEVDLGYELSGVGRFRINICQQRNCPRLVCRYIPGEILTLADLGMPAVATELLDHKRGLILVTGATGSGKSTTLAAMIDHIAKNRSCHIVTIEDPIEFVFKDRKSIVTQREVGLDTRGFAQALKYALRQDPDVILVGEMRDEETILMALNAAETGHLVLSTLHTIDATETVNRILGTISAHVQGQIRAQLASVLIGVISQRLLSRRDGSSRVVATEILINNARTRDMILYPEKTNDLSQVIEESSHLGMQTFDQCLLGLVEKDIITREEALNHCSNPRNFILRLGGVVPGKWREAEQQLDADRKSQIRRILDAQDHSQASIEIESVSRDVTKK